MKNPTSTTAALVLALALVVPIPAAAQHKAGDHAGHGSAAAPTAVQPAAEWVAGEVRKVDPTAKKITLKHGEIKSIGMPPMTMAYDLKDASLAKDLKVGDEVQFRATRGASGAYVITELRRSK